MISRLANYIKETREEMTHVSWPTRTQTTVFVSLVVLISLVLAAYLGGLDYVFSLGLKSLI